MTESVILSVAEKLIFNRPPSHPRFSENFCDVTKPSQPSQNFSKFGKSRHKTVTRKNNHKNSVTKPSQKILHLLFIGSKVWKRLNFYVIFVFPILFTDQSSNLSPLNSYDNLVENEVKVGSQFLRVKSFKKNNFSIS